MDEKGALTCQERGLQEPPVLFRQRARLSVSVADLIIAVYPDLASIQLRQHKLQYWRLTLYDSSTFENPVLSGIMSMGVTSLANACTSMPVPAQTSSNSYSNDIPSAVCVRCP